MADIIDTLHPEGRPNDNIYPNIKPDNIPSDVLNKINNSLQVPASPPTSNQLIGINIANRQFGIGIGEGLEVTGGQLKTTGSSITVLTTQYVRIWSLNPGVYKWTYSGAKYLYYSGATSTANASIPGSTGGEVILTVNKYSNSYKNWNIITGSSGYPVLYYGYTTSTTGYYQSKSMANLAIKPRIKSTFTRRTTATSTSYSEGLNVYIYDEDYQISDGDIITITVFAAPYGSISANTQVKHYTSLTFIKQDSSHGNLNGSYLMAETSTGVASKTPGIDGAISVMCSYVVDYEEEDYSHWGFTAYGKNANCTPYYVEVTVWNSTDLDIEIS